MIDNSDDIFLNLNNNPNPIATFNSIMRQYYDGYGNPYQRRQQTNENKEIVWSTIQAATTTGKLTLDLLLPKRSGYVITKEGTGKAGEEILASTAPPTNSKKNFDIRDFMKHYSHEQQTTTSSKKLTLAHCKMLDNNRIKDIISRNRLVVD